MNRVRKTKENRRLAVTTGILVLAVALALPALAASVEPEVVEGNPTCQDLGFAYDFKIDSRPDFNGTYNLPDGENTVTVTTSDQVVFDWESTLSMDAVFSKGGNAANVYRYDPESLGDTGLQSPDNASDGAAAISHINFCYDYEVKVAKTATTTYVRKWDWTVSKSASAETIKLKAGETAVISYQVSVAATSSDSDFAVSGEISIYNPAPDAAEVTAVTDSMTGGLSAAVSCPGGLPATVGSKATLTCTYSTALADGTDRVNTAVVETTGLIGGGEASADVTFGDPTSQTDDCVTVSDPKAPAGSLGQLCAGDAPKTFSYTVTVGPWSEEECGEAKVDNTATITTDDSGTSSSSSTSTGIEVECEPPGGGGQGCTPGYWRQEHHYDSWVGYTPDQLFADVFGVDYAGTLGEAVAATGGGNDALARHAVAALLNASSGGVDYPYSVSQVIEWTQQAFASGDPEDTKDKFDEANNLGCPLN